MYGFLKCIEHFMPHYRKWFREIQDFRMQKKITFPKELFILVRILAYLSAIKSVRDITFKLNTNELIENLKIILGCDIENMFHHDTLNYFLKKLPTNEIEELRKKMIKHLIRNKYFENFKIRQKYWLIAVDATGMFTFKERHCKHCLTKKFKNESTIYYHNVLEAKLIVGDMAFSIGTEFIENPNPNPTKQDCELKAFARLAEKLKKDYPRLGICILGDSLYASHGVMKICEDNNWKFIINLKEGSIPDVFSEFESIRKLEFKNRLTRNYDNKILRKFSWVNKLHHRDKQVDVFKCIEIQLDTGEFKEFVWITNFNVTNRNVEELGEGGRHRWKIENEGFNDQKNRGYNLEHPYAKNYNSVKNHYLLLQIAHIIGQLCENGSMLKKTINYIYGSFKNFSHKILEDLRCRILDRYKLDQILAEKIQIRFDST